MKKPHGCWGGAWEHSKPNHIAIQGSCWEINKRHSVNEESGHASKVWEPVINVDTWALIEHNIDSEWH